MSGASVRQFRIVREAASRGMWDIALVLKETTAGQL